MKFLNYGLFFFTLFSYSQVDTEIYLLDININSNNIEVFNSKIISKTTGYNNQPYFINDNQLLFISERDGQNDIVHYNIYENDNRRNLFKYLTNTTTSEYSPIQYKNNKVTAVSLDENGNQYLRIYDVKKNTFKIPFKDKVVGYYNHSKETKNLIVSSILENNELVLYSSNLKTREHVFIDNNTGRSIHPIPNNKFGEEKFTYISKKDSIWTINYVKLSNYKTGVLINTLENNEDICILRDGTILTSRGNKLYKINPSNDSKWVLLCSLEGFGITNISRISINPNNDKLALVNSK